jgi:hypothetical protein
MSTWRLTRKSELSICGSRFPNLGSQMSTLVFERTIFKVFRGILNTLPQLVWIESRSIRSLPHSHVCVVMLSTGHLVDKWKSNQIISGEVGAGLVEGEEPAPPGSK